MLSGLELSVFHKVLLHMALKLDKGIKFCIGHCDLVIKARDCVIPKSPILHRKGVDFLQFTHYPQLFRI